MSKKEGYVVMEVFEWKEDISSAIQKFEVYHRPEELHENEVVYDDLEEARREAARKSSIAALTGGSK